MARRGARALLGCEQPIIQAPMAGADTPELVAAVGDAGGIGFVGAAYLTPERIREAGRALRAHSSRPFGINLFAPTPAPAAGDLVAALARLAPYYAELGLPPPPLPPVAAPAFDDQLDAALDSGASIFSFTFGALPAATVDRIRARGLRVFGTATSVAEAIVLRDSGVDAVIAQGGEAGGHRGTFLGDFADAQVGTVALVPQVVDAIDLPVIASGGIMDGRGIAAALALGASAVQLGTAFLTCDESGVPEAYRQAILSASEVDTRVTRAFSGRPARGIANRLLREVGDDVPGFPLQNALTRPLRAEAARRDRAEFLSLWSGQAPRLARRMPAGELIARLVAETRAAIAAIGTD